MDTNSHLFLRWIMKIRGQEKCLYELFGSRCPIVTMRNPNISKKIFSATNRPLLGFIPVTILLLFNVVGDDGGGGGGGGSGSSLGTFTSVSAAAEKSTTTTTAMVTTTTQQYSSLDNTISSIASYNMVSLVNSTMPGVQEAIKLSNGHEFTITLQSNPGTGYQWIPTFNTTILNLVSHEYKPASTKLLGSPGTDVFTFKAINHGTDTVKMIYKRSWEKESVQEKVFLVSVT
jgi:inhibitor of cysteine peptidase